MKIKNEQWLAVDEDGTECLYDSKPIRTNDYWGKKDRPTEFISLPKGMIQLIIGRKLTWKDKPVRVKLVEDKRKQSCVE